MNPGALSSAAQAIWVVAATLVLTAPAAVAGPPNPAPSPILPPLAPGQVLRVGPVAGTGTATSDFGIGATDLCEFMDFRTELQQICGDSFAGQGVGFGRWFTPVALRVDVDSVNDPDGIRYTGVTGVDKPLLAEPAPPGASQLPAGVVQINRQNYLMVTTTRNLVPASSRLVRAEPGRAGWMTVADSVRPADYLDGAQTQISGYYDPIPTTESPRGWVYVVANSFNRSASLRLYRVAPQWFTDRSRWQGWSAGWNSTPTPLWPDQVGEMNLRQIDGKTVLSYFNASTGNMEIRVAAHPTGLGTAPVTTVVRADTWPQPPEVLPRDDTRLAQPYGGYISPGSTLDEVRVLISQWNTGPRDRAPYRVIQFAVNPFKP